MAEDRPFWEPAEDGEQPAAPASLEEIRRWEQAHDVRLPGRLVWALSIQDGGRVRGLSSLDLHGLGAMESLQGEEWAHVYEENDEGESEVTRKDRLFSVGDQYGCELVLDYRDGEEPRILIIEHDMGGRLSDPGFATFDELVRLPNGGAADA